MHHKYPDGTSAHEHSDHHADNRDAEQSGGFSRRDFLETTMAGLAAGTLAASGLAGTALADDFDTAKNGQSERGRRILLKGGVVLSLDPAVGDFAEADVLIEGSTIKEVRPNIKAHAQVIDARGMIVMPGFIDTHHHQYETIQRAIIADGNLSGNWPQESYGSVVQSIWTTGRIAGTNPGDPPIWDLGRSPYDPEDCYISELLASVSQINQGVTCGIDTSQSSHTPEHTDAMIQGLIDSGRRTLYAYGSGRNDDSRGGYEYPGAIDDVTSGLGRLRAQYFNSDDQLVTLGHTGGGPEGWALARSFGAVIVNHNNSNGQNIIDNADLLGPDIEMIHCARFVPEAYQICADKGVHISIATAIEMQMGHGTPPFQACLNVGILPSLSADVDTNMTPDMFTIMRSAFTLQRALVHARALAGETNLPPLLTCHQVLQMATIAGAVAAHVDHKVGTLTPGKEADIIMLQARALNTWPLNNAPGSVVTMMDTSNVDTVFIAGKLKKWRGKLVGVHENKLLREIEAARDRVFARIQAVPIPVDGLNSAPGYTPSLVGSCCLSDPYDATP
jgi:cytosine/adenosine deaminase-related metal-dependent hydrolase